MCRTGILGVVHFCYIAISSINNHLADIILSPKCHLWYVLASERLIRRRVRGKAIIVMK